MVGWSPLGQAGGAVPAAWWLEHVAVVGQGAGAPHRRLPHAQQVLVGGQRQRVVLGAEISLRGEKQ